MQVRARAHVLHQDGLGHTCAVHGRAAAQHILQGTLCTRELAGNGLTDFASISLPPPPCEAPGASPDCCAAPNLSLWAVGCAGAEGCGAEDCGAPS